MTGAHVYIYIYIYIPWLTSYVETLIIDAKMFENYGLEGGLGSSWEWSCMSGRRLWSQNLAERAKTGNLMSFLGSLGSKLRPKMAEVATKIAILASF